MVEIGDSTFSACKRLRTVTLPSSLGYIAPSAFRECELSEIKWERVNFPESVDDLFSDFTYENATFFVAPGGKANAETTFPWCKFRHIVEIEMSAIKEVDSSSSEVSVVEVYNLKGIKIVDSTEDLVPGVCVVNQNGTSAKLIVK